MALEGHGLSMNTTTSSDKNPERQVLVGCQNIVRIWLNRIANIYDETGISITLTTRSPSRGPHEAIVTAVCAKLVNAELNKQALFWFLKIFSGYFQRLNHSLLIK